jgi:hypothetical protein
MWEGWCGLARGSASFDFVFSALLFILMLGFAASSYSDYSVKYSLNEKKAGLETRIISISQSLVKSRGYPVDWENDASSIEVLGLAEAENTLSIQKVLAFDSIPYNETSDLLGISGEYYIELRSIKGTLQFHKGQERNASSVSIERLVHFNQTPSRLVIRLYEG